MKYRLQDIFDFEFHDSKLSLVSWDEERLVLSARHLNIHKVATPILTDTDMEIERAQITFYGFSVGSFEEGRAWKRDAEGISYTDDPLVVYTGEKACARLEQELAQGLTVYHLSKEKDEYEIEACGASPYFTARFTCGSIDVEWDAFLGKAWYEKQ